MVERGVIATSRIAAPLRLLVVLAVVSGLLASVPASCWCPADDHAGQLVHARFPHHHPSDRDAHAGLAGGAFGEGPLDAATASLATASLATASPATSAEAPAGPWWASAVPTAARGWQGGQQMLPPLFRAAPPGARGAAPAFDVARPSEHTPSPSVPPPR
jgi:hypothetical protein